MSYQEDNPMKKVKTLNLELKIAPHGAGTPKNIKLYVPILLKPKINTKIL